MSWNVLRLLCISSATNLIWIFIIVLAEVVEGTQLCFLVTVILGRAEKAEFGELLVLIKRTLILGPACCLVERSWLQRR